MMRKPKELRGTAQSNYSEICKLGHILEQEGCSFSENEKQKKTKEGKAKKKRQKRQVGQNCCTVWIMVCSKYMV